jgi:hypothetical protein
VCTCIGELARITPIPRTSNTITALYVYHTNNQTRSVSFTRTCIVHAQLSHQRCGIVHYHIVYLITAVLCTFIAVINNRRCPRLAVQPCITHLRPVTEFTIIAPCVIRFIHTPVRSLTHITTVYRARYTIIAIYVVNTINQTAPVLLARTSIVQAQLSHQRRGIVHYHIVYLITAVLCTFIGVINNRRRPRLTSQRSITHLRPVTEFTIIAQRAIRNVQYLVLFLIATVIRTHYPVINIRRRAHCTRTTLTGFFPIAVKIIRTGYPVGYRTMLAA